jgi:hypothetical protein
MRASFTAILLSALVGVFTLITFSSPSWAQQESPKKVLEDKLYRQALYYYFAGDYAKALRQISVNKKRYQAVNSQSQLFEAGLQVSVGLHAQASQTLKAFELTQSGNVDSNSEQVRNEQSSTSPNELLVIALLQLAEQQIQRNDNRTAQQTLSNIVQLPAPYYEQYQTLNQLAYWPETPEILVTVLTNEEEKGGQSRSAYVELNQALLHIEREEYDQAKALLTNLKNKRWKEPTSTFWQLLFNPFSDDSYVLSDDVEDDKIQQQAVNDYAKLLLAQMYVKQTRYEAAFYELKDFPQDSPYSESALFIFAFTAQKIKNYTTSLKLLNLIQKRYPYSNLGWQASMLLSAQIAEQKTLEQGMASYQKTEQFYQQQLAELNDFHHQFLTSNNLLKFASQTQNVDDKKLATLTLFKQNNYVTDSAWLKKALLNPELEAQYQTLIELDLLDRHVNIQNNKNQWIGDTLVLNNQRKAKIIERQQQTNYHELITTLNTEKQRIAKIIAEAERSNNGKAFANQEELQWLERIEQSKNTLNIIAPHKNIDDYQARIKRTEGALTWTLQKTFTKRLWQHKKLLKEIEQQLMKVEQQRSRFQLMAESPQLIRSIEARHQKSDNDISRLLANISQLRQSTNTKIHSNVEYFVEQQRNTLNQYLLTTRHEMAAVLERMSQVDKRIETQLVPIKQAAEQAPEQTKEGL